MKNHNILEAHKNKINMLNVKKTNLLEKIRFLESEHYSLLENNNALTQEIKSNKPFSSVNENFDPKTKVLNEILDKCKTLGDKRGLGYINKDKTPSSGETMLVEGKDEPLTKQNLLKRQHYAHTIRKLDILGLYVVLGS